MNDIQCLTNWRNKYADAFLTEFTSTVEQTTKWLSDFVDKNDNKILFMIDDAFGNTFGYMGLDYIVWENSYGEADAIVRGENAPKGTMKECLSSLLSWAKQNLELNTIGVRVLSDNSAISFYEKIGFVEHQRVPLKKVNYQNKSVWEEDTNIINSSRNLVYFLLQDVK